MRMAISALAALLALAAPASATESFGCEIDDKALAFSADGLMSRGLGSAILNFRASAEIRLKDAPEDFGKLALDKNLVHSWVEGGEFRLHLYYERPGKGPFASAELVIKTVMGEDEIEYPGTYRLTVFSLDPPAGSEGKTLTTEGKAACSLG